MDERLKGIMINYYNDFAYKNANPILSDIIVKNSFPIVWFGNMDKYFESKIKVLTIGLNPSNQEFPERTPYFRFPNAHIAYKNGDYGKVEKKLNDYFDYEPYDWFKAYERALSYFIFGVTYGGKTSRRLGTKNFALHIDFISAIATNPTYGKLCNWKKNELKRVDLFNQLYKYLNPDIVLFSTSKKEIQDFFHLIDVEYKLESKIELYKSNGKIFIWGKPNIKPFQGVKDTELTSSFQKINLQLSSC